MIVSHVLRLDQERAGFEVVEPDDHIVELRQHGRVVATFTPAVTIRHLRLIVDRVMWLEMAGVKVGGGYAPKT